MLYIMTGWRQPFTSYPLLHVSQIGGQHPASLAASWRCTAPVNWRGSGGAPHQGKHGMYHIEQLTTAQATQHLPGLVYLLQDAVHSGASLGFLPPLSEDVAYAYWRGVLTGMAQQTHRLLGAVVHNRLAGVVQLELATKPNAWHRAEVQKLCVLTTHRHQGIGRALMTAVEDLGRALGRTLLILDTRQGDSAERLYATLGWIRAGSIPQFARSADGSLDSTVIFYKLI